MSETKSLAKQSLDVRTVCPDCESSIPTCVICHQHVCSKHQKKVQRYFSRGLATMCDMCADDFVDYEWFVNPRYAVA